MVETEEYLKLLFIIIIIEMRGSKLGSVKWKVNAMLLRLNPGQGMQISKINEGRGLCSRGMGRLSNVW